MRAARAPGLAGRLRARIDRLRRLAGTPAAGLLGRLGGIALSLLVLGLLLRAIQDVGWRSMLAVLPTSPAYWLFFAGAYFLQPLSEYRVFRRWWGLGWRDLSLFLRMRVLNEAVLSYSGHSYLVAWATLRFGIRLEEGAPLALGRGDGPGANPAEAPFAAIKDMVITSGLAGIAATMLALLLALALDGGTILVEAAEPAMLKALAIGFGGLLLLNAGLLLFRGRVLSLRVADNLFALRWHFLRAVGTQSLITASWIVALPAIPPEAWALLAALRMVIGRLPVPNKELLFAAIAIALTGAAAGEVSALMASQGVLHLMFHALSWALAWGIDARAKAMPPTG